MCENGHFQNAASTRLPRFLIKFRVTLKCALNAARNEDPDWISILPMATPSNFTPYLEGNSLRKCLIVRGALATMLALLISMYILFLQL